MTVAEEIVDKMFSDDTVEVEKEHDPALFRNKMRAAGLDVSYAKVDKKGNLNARGRFNGARNTRLEPAEAAVASYIEDLGADVKGRVFPDIHSRNGVWFNIQPLNQF